VKLKIKLPLLFLFVSVLIIFSIAIYVKIVFIGKVPFIGTEMKEKYTAEYQKIANHVSSLYPDMEEINDYIKQIFENKNISIILHNSEVSDVILSYRKSPYKSVLTNYWLPVRTHDDGIVFFLEIESPIGIEDTVMSLEYIGMLLPLPVIICFTFIILFIYIHFNITKPIRILNSGLEKINIRRPFALLDSKRKDEIGDLYNRFNEMEGRLHLARKEQTDMIAAIAHDLKTPLTSISGFVELLITQKKLPEKEKQEYYELIQKKSKHIGELINYFSTFTKEELELESIDLKPVDVLKLFENIAMEYEIELSGLDYELTWNHSFTANLFLMIDEPMIRRVFGNLFSNAVRYGGTKGLKVYMNGYTQGYYTYFEVEDNGAGVPDKDISSLFLKFFTVDKSRQSRNGGMGLGLASCKAIIEHHGGEICAFHSGYGGLGIRFSLPLVM
jgi:signal transduction histidine kinase